MVATVVAQVMEISPPLNFMTGVAHLKAVIGPSDTDDDWSLPSSLLAALALI